MASSVDLLCRYANSKGSKLSGTHVLICFRTKALHCDGSEGYRVIVVVACHLFFLGTGTIVVFLEQMGTVELCKEVLNMSPKTADNCSLYVFKTRLEIPSGPTALRVLILLI